VQALNNVQLPALVLPCPVPLLLVWRQLALAGWLPAVFYLKQDRAPLKAHKQVRATAADICQAMNEATTAAQTFNDIGLVVVYSPASSGHNSTG